jgi:protein SCO1/2
LTAEFTHADRKDGIRKTVLILVAIIAVLVGLFFNRAFTPRILSPVEMVNNGAVIFSTPREISAFNLLDQYSEPFTLERLQDKWTFVFFGFTHCPDICPTTLALFNSLSDKLQDTDFFADTQFLLVSLDPARDTPEALKTYIQYFNPAFVGVTGDFFAIAKNGDAAKRSFSKGSD